MKRFVYWMVLAGSRLPTSFATLRRCFALIVALGAAAVPVHAATLTVLNTNDSGAGSLRNAIASATAGDTIVFGAGATGTIPLVTALSITQNLIIQGPGAGSLTLSGQSAIRVIDITGGTLTLSGVTIANASIASLGGGINVSASTTLILSNSVMSNNTASNGGAIAVAAGGTMTVSNTTFQGNTATAVGGGAIINFGTTTASGNTFLANTAPANGGAINNQPAATLTAINNTFRANSSAGLGGAISHLGTAVFINNTFSGNQATSGAAIAAGNTNVTLYNNLFADEVSGTAPSALNPDGGFPTSSHNLFYNNRAGGVVDDQTGYGTGNFTSTSTSPLAGLGNNGGLTQTLLPLLPGPAICAGSAALVPGGTTTDQRGSPRLAGACVDAGAVQRQQLLQPTVPQSIPTLSEWMLVLLSVLLALSARRRQPA